MLLSYLGYFYSRSHSSLEFAQCSCFESRVSFTVICMETVSPALAYELLVLLLVIENGVWIVMYHIQVLLFVYHCYHVRLQVRTQHRLFGWIQCYNGVVKICMYSASSCKTVTGFGCEWICDVDYLDRFCSW